MPLLDSQVGGLNRNGLMLDVQSVELGVKRHTRAPKVGSKFRLRSKEVGTRLISYVMRDSRSFDRCVIPRRTSGVINRAHRIAQSFSTCSIVHAVISPSLVNQGCRAFLTDHSFESSPSVAYRGIFQSTDAVVFHNTSVGRICEWNGREFDWRLC